MVGQRKPTATITQMDIATETFRTVPFAPLYEVSQYARVRKVACKTPIAATPATKGRYLTCALNVGEARLKTFYLHRIVASCWCPLAIEGKVVHHVSGTVLDCTAANLAVVSAQENAAFSVSDGTAGILRGEASFHTRRGDLTHEQVRCLRRARASGKRGAVARLAREWNVSSPVCSAAARGVTYRYVLESSLATELLRLEQEAVIAARRAAAKVKRAKASRLAHTLPPLPPATKVRKDGGK